MRNASGTGRNDWDAWGFGHGTFSNEHTLGPWEGELASGGVVAVMDHTVSAGLLAGGFIACGAGDLDAPDGNEATVRSIAAGLYASYDNAGLHGNATFGVGHLHADSDRSIRFAKLQRMARADWDGTSVFGSVSGGYSFPAGPWSFGPTAALFADWTRFDAARESGAGSLDLRVDDRSAASLRSMIGVEASYEQRVANGFLLVPQASLLWAHEFLEDSDELDARFAAGRGPAFTYDPQAADEDSMILSAMLNVISPWELHGGLGYHVRFDESGGVDHSITLGIDQTF